MKISWPRNALLILLPMIAVAIATVSCASGATPVAEDAVPTVEIREYEGKDLSSINAFRENSIEGPQSVDIETYHLEISGLVGKPLSLDYDEIILRYPSQSKVVTLHCVEGWSATILWEGVPVKSLIEEAVPDPEGKVVIFHAYDGYTTSFPIEYLFDNNILMAYKMNGVTLPEERGFPFQLVAESKWGYKWIKWITNIEVSDDEEYQGYWESRGYPNDADLPEWFLDR